MKIFVVFLVFISIISNAQKKCLDTLILEGNGYKINLRIQKTYDSKGNLASKKETQFTAINTITTDNQYNVDANNNVTTLFSTVNGKTIMSNRYEYNDNNQIIRISQNGTANQSVTFNGNTEIRNFLDPDGSIVGSEKLTYSPSKQLISIDQYTRSGALSKFTLYEYSNHNKVASMTEIDPFANLKKVTKYTYNNNIQLLKKEEYISDKLKYQTDYKYKNGNLLRESKTDVVLKSNEYTRDFEYSTDNLLIEEKTSLNGILKSIRKLVYDKKNNVSVLLNTLPTGVITSKTEYFYNCK